MDNFFYEILQTSFGFVGIVFSKRGLLYLTLPNYDYQKIEEVISSENKNKKMLSLTSSETFKKNKINYPYYEKLIQAIKSYFSGEEIYYTEKVNVIIDWSFCTPFQKRVYQVVRNTPYGQLKSYQWVAEQIGCPNGARAVGHALTKNKIPIVIPCHRVIRKNGNLGGFSGGLELKEKLLKLENIKLD